MWCYTGDRLSNNIGSGSEKDIKNSKEIKNIECPCSYLVEREVEHFSSLEKSLAGTFFVTSQTFTAFKQ